MPTNSKHAAAPKRARKSAQCEESAEHFHSVFVPAQLEFDLVRVGVDEMAELVKRVAKKFNWSNERVEQLAQRVSAYQANPSIKNYVRIRREFPEVDAQSIQVTIWEGAKMEEFERRGIDPNLIAGSIAPKTESIDALCLRLLELLIARSELPTKGRGYIEKRREAISDSTVNYLIAEVFDALHRGSVRVPASLVVLTREQLCGSNPDLYQAYLASRRFQQAAISAGRYFPEIRKTISVRKLAAVEGVGLATAARWLADKEFQPWSEVGRRMAAGEWWKMPPDPTWKMPPEPER